MQAGRFPFRSFVLLIVDTVALLLICMNPFPYFKEESFLTSKHHSSSFRIMAHA
jgi:hypothetical protein